MSSREAVKIFFEVIYNKLNDILKYWLVYERITTGFLLNLKYIRVQVELNIELAPNQLALYAKIQT